MRAWVVCLGLLVSASRADAFCGFYVASGDQPMTNDATQVVLMRAGTRTVLSMQNNYKGPPEAFALVVPVPVVLHEADVKTLDRDVFDRVEKMGAPRLVEYWEQDPCQPDYVNEVGNADMAMVQKSGMREELADATGVKVEAKFAVGEYQIVILSATDSTGLEKWLLAEHYKIPNGAAPLLRPYVEAGSKFFVAKVDPTKVKFDANGRAALSPLRFHYDSDEFSLPIRLGLASSSGTQDLIVNILAPHQRYDVANYPNVTIPTNIDVTDGVRGKFGGFYAALFDRTLETHPHAVVTEYAWQASTCDPCPGPTLNASDFETLGADVVPQALSSDLVLTRLHARYGKEVNDDLRFRAAQPIVGGRESVKDGGKLEEGAQPSSTNNFQGRYAIRHEWLGPIACSSPRRGIWGGPSGGNAAQAATQLAFAPRGEVQLPMVIKRDLPEIDVRAGAAATIAAKSGAVATGSVAHGKSGCGCDSGASNSGGLVLAGLGLAALGRRRRPTPSRER